MKTHKNVLMIVLKNEAYQLIWYEMGNCRWKVICDKNHYNVAT